MIALDIASTEFAYIVLGSGILFLGAMLLRIDFRLTDRYNEVANQVADLELKISNVTAETTLRAGERRIEERVATLSRQQEQLLARDSETWPYLQAIRHAENGAGIEALMERTGVTRAEAELISILHRKSAVAGVMPN